MTCREGFDLFNKGQRKNFFRKGIFGDKFARHYVLKDTFGKYVCKMFGHSRKIYNLEDCDGTKFKLCDRCYRRI